MLATAQVRILASSGRSLCPIRALTDSGSQLNLITHDCVQRHQLRYTPAGAEITGIGNTNAMHSIGFIDTHLQHRTLAEPLIPVRLLVVSKISTRLPIQRTQHVFTSEISSDQLADPSYWIPSKIDMLLGAGIWARIVTGEIVRKVINSTVYLAQNTCFGWTILASSKETSGETSLTLHVSKTNDVLDLEHLDRTIKKFWQIETIPLARPLLTRDEQLAEDNFLTTFTRDTTGRYTVTIPFRQHIPALGDSKQAALKRLHSLETRLATRPELCQEYHNFIMDYLDSGHMIPAPPPSDNNEVYYIPYHAIIKKKFRIVFDASCTTSTGVSLNDHQLIGPKMQDDLCKILLRFRLNRYAVSADIVKMFRQVQINKRHWDYQRILWRPSIDQPIQEFFITVVVWGMASATFNAVRALRQCALDGKSEYPVASRAALEDFYVDDFLSGTDDKTTLTTLYEQMNQMLQSGGFHLSKWCTNNKELATLIGQQTTTICD